jgi:hypothetical protein
MCIPLRHTFKHKPIVSFYTDALFLSFKLEGEVTSLSESSQGEVGDNIE